MKEYDIFLFDADGTLFDFDRAEVNALKIVFDYYGSVFTEDVLLAYRKISSQLWERLEKSEVTIRELKVSRFTSLFNEIDIYYDAKEFNEKYMYELGKGAFLIDGAFKICKDIISCNKKIYIITNGMIAVQKARIKYSAINEYISDFFVSEAIGFQKPHIQYFEYVLSHIPKIGKDRILIIGDSLSIDIAGGNNADIDSCWLNISGAINNTNIIPTYEISSLRELHGFIHRTK